MSGNTPLWNKVIIYVGILFAFLVVCMFITILTPSIRKEEVIQAEQKQFPDEFWRKMRRQSYLGLGAMLFSNFVVIGAIIAMGFQSQKAEKNRGKPKSALVDKEKYDGGRRGSYMNSSMAISRTHSSSNSYSAV